MNLDKIDDAIKDVRKALDLLAKHELTDEEEEQEQKLLLLKGSEDGKEETNAKVKSKKKEPVKEPQHKIIHLKVSNSFLLIETRIYEMIRDILDNHCLDLFLDGCFSIVC